MKVVRSKRLENVLRDPKAAEQLRTFLASASVNELGTVRIDTQDADGKRVRYQPQLVPVLGSGK